MSLSTLGQTAACATSPSADASQMTSENFFSDPDLPAAILWDESSSLEIRAATKVKLIEKLCHEVYYGASAAAYASLIAPRPGFRY